MREKEGMIGKSVTLFLDGGWQITGEVKSFDDNKFTVEQNGDLFMVFKDKVSCLLMSEENRAAAMPVASTSSKSMKERSSSQGDEATFPMNSIAYDESSMSIPGALLSGLPDDDDDDLSVFFTDSKTSSFGSDSGIVFKVGDDDSEDQG